MAKINGIEIKDTTIVKLNEGTEEINGEVYMDNEKIGAFKNNTEQFMGVSIKDVKYHKKFIKRCKKYSGVEVHEELIYHLLKLIIKEKQFKPAIEKGYDGIGVIDYAVDNMIFNINTTNKTYKFSQGNDRNKGNRTRGHIRYKPKMEIYTDNSDFNIKKKTHHKFML